MGAAHLDLSLKTGLLVFDAGDIGLEAVDHVLAFPHQPLQPLLVMLAPLHQRNLLVQLLHLPLVSFALLDLLRSMVLLHHSENAVLNCNYKLRLHRFNDTATVQRNYDGNSVDLHDGLARPKNAKKSIN